MDHTDLRGYFRAKERAERDRLRAMVGKRVRVRLTHGHHERHGYTGTVDHVGTRYVYVAMDRSAAIIHLAPGCVRVLAERAAA